MFSPLTSRLTGVGTELDFFFRVHIALSNRVISEAPGDTFITLFFLSFSHYIFLRHIYPAGDSESR